MKLNENQMQNICNLIEQSLNKATLIGLVDDDGNAYQLLDLLSFEQPTIKKGQEEIRNIVEQVYFDLAECDIDFEVQDEKTR